MARKYAFRDLIQFSGSDKNPVTNWVQKGAIPADEGDTSGTGIRRAFSFFNVFEACIAHQLNQLPGGMPIRELTLALDAIRLRAHYDDPARAERVREQLARLSEAEAAEVSLLGFAIGFSPLGPQYFADFLDPQTRKPEATFWLAWSPRLGFAEVIDSQELLNALLRDMDTVVLVNLHQLLLELEETTGDHWTRPPLKFASAPPSPKITHETE